MDIDLSILAIILLGTSMIATVSILNARGIWQRMLLFGFYSGLCLYSGVGAAYSDVPNYYTIYYFGFLISFAFAFSLFRHFFTTLSIRSGKVLQQHLHRVDTSRVWHSIVFLFLFLHFIPLIYPEIKLHQLIFPPAPDLRSVFAARWESQEMDILRKLVDYACVLLTPFFYIALFRYRQRIMRLFLIIATLLYLQYVATGYIGRGTVLMAIGIIGLALWVYYPKKRFYLTILALLAIPFILVGSYFYAIIRLGGTPTDIAPTQAALKIVESETSFPRNVGMPIIESIQRVDMKSYVTWILTLPIPKILTGEIKGARINYEISEIILERKRGQSGWYIVLPGLVAESIYIFGNYFFWLHAAFIAFLAVFLIRLLEKTPQLLFLNAFVVVTFSYHLNRAGISGPLPLVINGFLLFYVFVFLCAFRLIKTTNRCLLQNKKGQTGGKGACTKHQSAHSLY